jgi:ribosomal protein S18 acetylase RimI-like enzyme
MSELTLRLHGHRYQVRPMETTDGPAVLAAFEALTEASRRFRFFSATPRLPATIAADLTRTGPDRIVLVAIAEDGTIAAEARAVRHRADPATADLAITVAESHRRLGLGSRLLRSLRREARAAGIDRFVGHVMVDNAAAQALLVAGRAACWFDEPGVLAFEIPLGMRTVAPAIAARRTLGLAS